jgi:hypothetical protein
MGRGKAFVMADWSPLYEDGHNPVPGDPDQIDALQRWFRRMSDDVAESVSALRRFDIATGWRDQAARRFDAAMGKLKEDLPRLRDCYDRAAWGLWKYESALRDAQRRAQHALAMALEAKANTDSAARAKLAVPSDADVTPYERQAQDAAQLLTVARSEADQARHDRQAAAHACIGVLQDASHTGMHTMSFWERLEDAIAGIGRSNGDVPPGPGPRVLEALVSFHGHLGGASFLTGDRGDLEGIDERLAGLSADELNGFIDSLSQQDLQEWNRRISDGGGLLFHQHGLSAADREALGNILLRRAGPEQLARLRRFMPGLEPDPSVNDVHLSGWRSGEDLPLFNPGTGGPAPDTDINQGLDGDCWFLSALGAIAARNPDLITRHVHANSNGTYTVTFYRDGHPQEVTVTDDYPSTPGGYAYAHPSTGGKWAMVYEKAYAQMKGGYRAIYGGFGQTGLADLTGAHASSGRTGDHTLADISEKINHGYAVTSSSQRQWPWDRDMEHSPGGKVVREHEYSVQSTNLSSLPPTITLVNPWGVVGQLPST